MRTKEERIIVRVIKIQTSESWLEGLFVPSPVAGSWHVTRRPNILLLPS